MGDSQVGLEVDSQIVGFDTPRQRLRERLMTIKSDRIYQRNSSGNTGHRKKFLHALSCMPEIDPSRLFHTSSDDPCGAHSMSLVCSLRAKQDLLVSDKVKLQRRISYLSSLVESKKQSTLNIPSPRSPAEPKPKDVSPRVATEFSVPSKTQNDVTACMSAVLEQTQKLQAGDSDLEHRMRNQELSEALKKLNKLVFVLKADNLRKEEELEALKSSDFSHEYYQVRIQERDDYISLLRESHAKQMVSLKCQCLDHIRRGLLTESTLSAEMEKSNALHISALPPPPCSSKTAVAIDEKDLLRKYDLLLENYKTLHAQTNDLKKKLQLLRDELARATDERLQAKKHIADLQQKVHDAELQLQSRVGVDVATQVEAADLEDASTGRIGDSASLADDIGNGRNGLSGSKSPAASITARSRLANAEHHQDSLEGLPSGPEGDVETLDGEVPSSWNSAVSKALPNGAKRMVEGNCSESGNAKGDEIADEHANSDLTRKDADGGSFASRHPDAGANHIGTQVSAAVDFPEWSRLQGSGVGVGDCSEDAHTQTVQRLETLVNELRGELAITSIAADDGADTAGADRAGEASQLPKASPTGFQSLERAKSPRYSYPVLNTTYFPRPEPKLSVLEFDFPETPKGSPTLPNSYTFYAGKWHQRSHETSPVDGGSEVILPSSPRKPDFRPSLRLPRNFRHDLIGQRGDSGSDISITMPTVVVSPVNGTTEPRAAKGDKGKPRPQKGGKSPRKRREEPSPVRRKAYARAEVVIEAEEEDPETGMCHRCKRVLRLRSDHLCNVARQCSNPESGDNAAGDAERLRQCARETYFHLSMTMEMAIRICASRLSCESACVYMYHEGKWESGEGTNLPHVLVPTVRVGDGSDCYWSRSRHQLFVRSAFQHPCPLNLSHIEAVQCFGTDGLPTATEKVILVPLLASPSQRCPEQYRRNSDVLMNPELEAPVVRKAVGILVFFQKKGASGPLFSRFPPNSLSHVDKCVELLSTLLLQYRHELHPVLRERPNRRTSRSIGTEDVGYDADGSLQKGIAGEDITARTVVDIDCYVETTMVSSTNTVAKGVTTSPFPPLPTGESGRTPITADVRSTLPVRKSVPTLMWPMASAAPIYGARSVQDGRR